MNVLIFGATGMVGQGVLRECLRDRGVSLVKTIGRTATGITNPKLQEIVRKDLWNYRDIEPEFTNLDACFFCLGVTSAGVSEPDYERVTYAIPLAAAQTLSRLNPQMTFIYVSGAGADSSEKGHIMWARIKGKAENALQRLPFKAVYSFRPGFIQPLHGIQSRTAAYRIFYNLTGSLLPLLRRAFPTYVLTTETIGRAMLQAVRTGAPKPVLESKDINALVR
jgi:uncharacterized protein YbjT (DUF2867 family)